MPIFGDLFLSEILKKPVLDSRGEVIGRMKDIIVVKGDPLPKISDIIIEKKKDLFRVRWEDINIFNKRIISTSLSKDSVKTYHVSEDDLLAVRDILSKQIVDVYGAKAVKVHDIKIESYENEALFTSVDVGIRGILRRVGFEGATEALLNILNIDFPHSLIGWNYIQPLKPKLKSIALTIPRQMVSELHPADIAEIISKISREDGTHLIKDLDVETAAEAISELQSEVQAELINAMDTEEAADIIEEMTPDDAADVLIDLPTEKAREILGHIEKEDAEDIRELLIHKEDSAGGLMTNQFVSYELQITVSEALEKFKRDAQEIETVYYIYVIDKAEKLLGVLSLRELILANPNAKLSEIMETKLIEVSPDEDVEIVAELMSKYDLVAIPVVDSANCLLGVVTVDDIIDVLEEEATEDLYHVAGTSEIRFGKIEDARPIDIVKSRLPWLFVCLSGGLISSMVVSSFQETLTAIVVLAAFIPVIMGMAGNSGLQISTTMVRNLALNSISNYWRYVAKELVAGFTTAAITGVTIAVAAMVLKGMPMLGLVVGIAMFLSISTSTVLALLTPTIAEKVGIDPAITAGPFVTVFNDIVGLTIYFTVATLFMKHLL